MTFVKTAASMEWMQDNDSDCDHMDFGHYPSTSDSSSSDDAGGWAAAAERAFADSDSSLSSDDGGVCAPAATNAVPKVIWPPVSGANPQQVALGYMVLQAMKKTHRQVTAVADLSCTTTHAHSSVPVLYHYSHSFAPVLYHYSRVLLCHVQRA